MTSVKLPPKPVKEEALSAHSQRALDRFITANVVMLDEKSVSMARVVADCSEMVEGFTTTSGKYLSGPSKHAITKFACNQISQRNPKLQLDKHLDDTIKLTVDLSKGKFSINTKPSSCGWFPCGTVDIGVDKNGNVSLGFQPPVQDLPDQKSVYDPMVPEEFPKKRQEEPFTRDYIIPPVQAETDTLRKDDEKGDVIVNVQISNQATNQVST